AEKAAQSAGLEAPVTPGSRRLKPGAHRLGHPTDHHRRSATKARPAVISHRVALDLFTLCELAVVLLAGVLAKLLWVDALMGYDEPLSRYLPGLVVLPPLFYLISKAQGLYKVGVDQAPPLRLGRSTIALSLAFLMTVAVGYLFSVADDYSRGWALLWLGLSVVGVLTIRLAGKRAFSDWVRAGLFEHRVAIVGDPVAARLFAEQLRQSNPGVRVVSLTRHPHYEPGSSNQSDAPPSASFDVSGLNELLDLGQDDGLDQIFIMRNPHGRRRDDDASPVAMADVLEHLSILPIQISLVTEPLAPGVPVRTIERNGDRAFLEVQSRPISDHGVWLKAAEDYVLGVVAAILFAPVMAMVAIAIKLEAPGPVFFKQRRHGYNHKIITVWKFRTMRVLEDGPSIKQATKDDDRVTKVGKFLRKTSLDELPQLINVLKGEMSLVGPRPHAVAHNEMYSEMLQRYANRHRVKPGITGWAQIHGYRGPTEDPQLMRERVALDLEYIERWSIWLDLRILIATPIYGFIGRNAF
ncbi:MAG: undecaprenyl-phosphate glucose phosphotransferase, partial [Pseudomonadota bacterium]